MASHSSKLLINEDPLQLLPTLAALVGLNEAIVLQQMQYWLKRSDHFISGVKWIYNTYAEWQEQFPFWSTDTIRRIIVDLEDRKLIKSGVFNKMKTDRTKWYTIDYDALDALIPCDEITPPVQGATFQAGSPPNPSAPVAGIDARNSQPSLPETTQETNTESTTESGDAKKSASPTVGKPSVMVDGKPEYTTSTPDTTASASTPGVTNGNGTNAARNDDDPSGLFAGITPPPPREKHTPEELRQRYMRAELGHLAMYADIRQSEWADEKDVRLARVLECFSKATGLHRPPDKRTVSSWRSEAHHWLDAYKTPEHFAQVMGIYAERKRQGRYKFDVTSPYSLHNTLWAIESELMSRGQGSDPNVITIGDTGGQVGIISGSSGQNTIRIHDTVRPI